MRCSTIVMRVCNLVHYVIYCALGLGLTVVVIWSNFPSWVRTATVTMFVCGCAMAWRSMWYDIRRIHETLQLAKKAKELGCDPRCVLCGKKGRVSVTINGWITRGHYKQADPEVKIPKFMTCADCVPELDGRHFPKCGKKVIDMYLECKDHRAEFGIPLDAPAPTESSPPREADADDTAESSGQARPYITRNNQKPRGA